MRVTIGDVKWVLVRFWPSGLTLGVVLWATLLSSPLGDTAMPAIPHLDKLIHAVMMGGLFGAVAFDAYRGGVSRLSSRFLLWLAAGVMLFGGVDEMAQWLMHNGRSGDGWDLVADCVGTLVAVCAAPPVIRRVVRRRG